MCKKLTQAEQDAYRRIVFAVDELRDNGVGFFDACCQVGCNTGTYYNQKKRDGLYYPGEVHENATEYYDVSDPSEVHFKRYPRGFITNLMHELRYFFDQHPDKLMRLVKALSL